MTSVPIIEKNPSRYLLYLRTPTVPINQSNHSTTSVATKISSHPTNPPHSGHCTPRSSVRYGRELERYTAPQTRSSVSSSSSEVRYRTVLRTGGAVRPKLVYLSWKGYTCCRRLRCAMLRCAMLCCAALCYAALRYAMLRCAMLCCAALCYAALRYAMLRCAMLCCAALCYAALRYAMLR